MTTPPTALRRRPLLGALAGLLAALAALAAAELAAAALRPEASPVVAIGGSVIDATPTWLREFAVRSFGTNDKLVLKGTILVLLVLLALVTGAIAVRYRGVGLAGVVVLGLVGATAAYTRPEAEPLDPFPSLVGAFVGCVVLILLLRPLSPQGEAPADERRRQLLVTAVWVGAGALAVGVAGRVLRSRRADVAAERAAIDLPAPATPAAVAAGTDLAVPGLSPFTTPTQDFYRIDTALVVPQVSSQDWRLRVHGMVDREVELDFRQLLARDLVERDITLTCVSNEVGGDLVGNARWLGAPLADVLTEAGVHPDADMILSRSTDGMTIGTPTAVVMDGRDAHAGGRHERRAVARGARLPGADGGARALRLRLGHQVGRRPRAHPVRQGDGVLGGAGVGGEGADQDGVPHRHASAVRRDPGRAGRGGRCRLGAAPRHRQGRGARRPRPVAGRAARRGAVARTPGGSGSGSGTRSPAATPWRPGRPTTPG